MSANTASESLGSFLAGHGNAGTSEVKLSAVNFPIRKHVVIRAASGNSATLLVGPPGSAASGFALAAGEQTPPIFVYETNRVRAIGSAPGQDFSWVAN